MTPDVRNDEAVGGSAEDQYRTLRQALAALADEVEINDCACECCRGDETPHTLRALLATFPGEAAVPDYVHALVRSVVTGRPLDFEGAKVPTEVQEALLVATKASDPLHDVAARIEAAQKELVRHEGRGSDRQAGLEQAWHIAQEAIRNA